MLSDTNAVPAGVVVFRLDSGRNDAGRPICRFAVERGQTAGKLGDLASELRDDGRLELAFNPDLPRASCATMAPMAHIYCKNARSEENEQTTTGLRLFRRAVAAATFISRADPGSYTTSSLAGHTVAAADTPTG